MESEIRFQASTVVEAFAAIEAAVTIPRWFAWKPKLGTRANGSVTSGLFGSVRDSVVGYRDHRSAVGEASSHA